MATSLARGIERRLRETWADVPVVLLEGGRAVGKTTLCRQLQDAGIVEELVDLTDPTVRSAAEDDPFDFVRRLATPAVIDEAQMVPDIVPAVKQAVDRSGRSGIFVLTGSTTLGRGHMGGSDPLAGRAARIRLASFTQGERSGAPLDLVQSLRRNDLIPHRTGSPANIEERLLVGGLPGIPGVLRPGGSPSTRRDAVAAYVEGVLHLATTASRADRARLLDLFRAVAGTPALVLNVAKLANDMGLAPATAQAYLRLLQDGFLLDAVPALASDARREAKGHPRLVPADVSLAVWAGRHTSETLRADTTIMGPLLHALVVNELAAQGAWSARAEIYHWRLRNDEVDAVVRYPDGTQIPIEIKAARAVNRHDTRGLQAFRRRAGRTDLAIVFYLGNRSYEIEPGIWALPVQALWETEFAARDTTEIPAPSPGPPVTPIPPSLEPPARGVPAGTPEDGRTVERATDAALFMSYVHEDDRAMKGRITQLARAIDDQYRFLTGEALEVFTDENLDWGDPWRSRIDEQLARATFFVPVVTPRFLLSRECRRETQAFLAVARSAGVDELYVLPIFLVAPETLGADDPLAAALGGYHGQRFEDLIYEDPESSDYRRAVNELAKRLVDAVRKRVATEQSVAPDDNVETSGDVLQLMERAEDSMRSLPRQLDRYRGAIETVMRALDNSMTDMQAANAPRSVPEFRGALRRVANDIREPVQELDHATTEIEGRMSEVDDAVTGLIRLATSNEGEILGVRQALSQVADDVPDGLGIDSSEIATVRSQMNILGQLATEMRAPVRTLERALLLVSDIDTMLRRWRRDTERFSPA